MMGKADWSSVSSDNPLCGLFLRYYSKFLRVVKTDRKQTAPWLSGSF